VQKERIEIRGFGQFQGEILQWLIMAATLRPAISSKVTARNCPFSRSARNCGNAFVAELFFNNLVVLDGELAVPCNPKTAYAGLKSLLEDCSAAVDLLTRAADWTLRNRRL